MKNPIRVLVAMLIGIAAMLGLALAGGSAASAATVGAQNFTILSNDASSNTSVVLANGVIHARGVDRAHPSFDVLRFRDGALAVTHHKVFSRDNLDRVTCVDRYSERGTYRIVLGSRDYRGATGGGVYTVTALAVYQQSPSGRCLTRLAPQLFQSVIEARGSISLPLV